MKKYEKYIETSEFPGNTHLQISVYYSKDSYPRGFYLSVYPVTLKDGLVSTMILSGTRKLLSQVTRYTEKQHNAAIENSKEYEQELIDILKKKLKSA